MEAAAAVERRPRQQETFAFAEGADAPESKAAPRRRIERWQPSLEEVQREDLTGRAAELAALLGMEAFRRLIGWRGGAWLKVPISPRGIERLAEAIGPEAAQRLSTDCAGEELRLPTLWTLCRPARDRALAREHEDGRTLGELARRFGLTQHGVYQALRRLER